MMLKRIYLLLVFITLVITGGGHHLIAQGEAEQEQVQSDSISTGDEPVDKRDTVVPNIEAVKGTEEPTPRSVGKVPDENTKTSPGTMQKEEVMTWLALSSLLSLFIGFLMGMLVFRKKRSSVAELATDAKSPLSDEPKAIAGNSTAAVFKEQQRIPDSVPVEEVPLPKVEDYHAFTDQWRELATQISTLAATASKETSLKGALTRIVEGRGEGQPGLQTIADDWQARCQVGDLTRNQLLADIVRPETMKNLAWLYRLQSIAEIEPTKQYLSGHKINPATLREAAEGFFRLLETKLGLSFDLPSFGDRYDESKYDLVRDNVGALTTPDGGALLMALENWKPGVERPIVDVGDLGLLPGSDAGDFADRFPKRTTVAYK